MTLRPYEIEQAFEDGLEDSERREAFAKENEGDFEDYIWEHFKEIVSEFESHLHPRVLLDDEVDEQTELFSLFVWEVLDSKKLAILCRSYCESNWDSYKDFVSEFVGQLGEF